MTADEVRRKYVEFFKVSPRNHKEIKPSPLILKDDDTTLFTSAGMQQLVPYLAGEKKHPRGVRLVDSQPSFRAVDIEEVGDSSHTTFFEMLGNWSLGDYFKKEQIPWIWEFLTKELHLPKERLYITVFQGGDGVARDEESVEIWKSLGVPDEKISYYGADKNWWSRAGAPKAMPAGEIGGPSTEVFYEFTSVQHSPKFGEACHPNCQCGRFLEIANSVFIQYKKTKEGKLQELPQKNVDHGAGLERVVAAVNDEADVFRIDLLWPIVTKAVGEKSYKDFPEDTRVIADHLRAAIFLASEGLEPANKMQGYVLRRLIRRSVYKISKLGLDRAKVVADTVDAVFGAYKNSGLLRGERKGVEKTISDEADKFLVTLDKGVKDLESQEKISPQAAFNSLATYGIPFEVTQEIASNKGQRLDKEAFDKEVEKHKELSRKGGQKKFKGGK